MSETQRNMMKIARVRVSVAVEVMTLDGTQDEHQVIGREPWGWSRTMQSDDVIVPGANICDMDPETASRYITEAARVSVENMLESGYDPAND